MKFRITARWWNDDLQSTFGSTPEQCEEKWHAGTDDLMSSPAQGVLVELPESSHTLLTMLEPFGRFRVNLATQPPRLHFENDYD